MPTSEASESDSHSGEGQVTITLLTHHIDRASEESFVHPSGLAFLLAGARLSDCHETETGELHLEFQPGQKPPNPGAEGWTVILPAIPSDEPSDQDSGECE